ncbi:MAG: DUF3849 domain-containing protein [Abditibacteriota bacterium]|nr:DUF3849 domain-containing protein [Abditibacteriota bacterium]
MAEPKEIDYKTIPVYPYGSPAAEARGEIELHDTSRWADEQCRDAIAAYYRHRRGANLPDDAVKGILEQFGAERVAFVLANVITLYMPDNGFCQSNQEWARVIPAFCPLRERWHPSMGIRTDELDALITKARQVMGRIPALEEKAAELKAIPVYPYSMMDAMHSNEQGQYWTSLSANTACKEAIESAIIRHSWSHGFAARAAALEVVGMYGFDRTLHVLATSIRLEAWDRRYSADNVKWAKSMPVTDRRDPSGHDNSMEYVVGRKDTSGLNMQGKIRNPAFTNLLTTTVRQEYALEQERSAAREQAENPLKNAEMLMEDDSNMLDGIINNGRKETGPPAASQPETAEPQEQQRRRSIREQLAEKPPEREKPTVKPRSRETTL